MVKGTKELIRDMNTSSVIETIIKHAPLSRIDISKITGLTKGTISSITQELIDSGLVEETGTFGNGVGRKSTMLKLKSNCGFIISIEIEKGAIRLMAFDMGGQRVLSSSFLFLEHEEIISVIKEAVDKCIIELPNSDYGVVNIVLSCECLVKNNHIIYSVIEGLSEIDFELELFDEFGVPVFVYNTACLGVLGENLYSAHVKNIALVNICNSVNMGLISDGHLFLGSAGQACDISHMTIEASGVECPCGNRGCLDLYASVPSILKIVSEQKQHSVSFDEFRRLFNSNDVSAQNAASHFIKYMSIALKNIIRLYNPEIIVINSPFTIYFDEIFLRLKNSLGENKGILYRSMLKSNASMYGGAVIGIKKFLKIENFAPSMCYFSNFKIL
ncbi:MAG: ROK family transcriptional regulator [Firmicutes bacterium]|nr:ROK family transcriptional regulator [Bacillota bacterium]